MNNKSNTPIAYHGKWTIPQYNNLFMKKINKEYMGTLYYYGDRDSELELYLEPPIHNESISSSDVIFGLDAYGRKFSVFDAKIVGGGDFRKSVLKAEYFVISREQEPVKSYEEELYTQCYVEYPYLRDWAFRNIFQEDRSITNSFSWDISKGLNFEVEIEEGIKFKIVSSETHQNKGYEFSVEQTTKLYIEANKPQSIYKFATLIVEFSRFLSIATFSKHTPTAVYLKREKSKYPLWFEQLMYSVKSTNKPQGDVLKFNKIVIKKPEILRRWHECYEQMAPITKYLAQAVTEQKNEFDAPDFLIIAQALDGYFKRFVNKKDGKNTKQYEHQIKKLLEHFKGVKALQACNLDAKVLTDSRNKYSHLIPDDDTKSVEKAASGEELYYLTRKAIVLLTCCVLDNLGLTPEEINVCFEDSVIEDIVNDIPPWYNDEK
ncbi:MAG: hypothetical protein Q4F45_02535 [Alistipes sp.]|nr:hypothetical protein [Alistipes sp.]